jgi:hypothetical protein
MPSRAQEQGMFLNHVELLHRPGERALAVEFFRALGCSTQDLTTGFGASRRITGVFAGAGSRDALNNVLYLSEFRQPNDQLDNLLHELAKENDELKSAIERHARLRSRPGDVTHFGLRYESLDALTATLAHLQTDLPTALVGRVTVYPASTVRLGDLGVDATQAFVHTDIVGTGLFPFGQLIELQAQTPLGAPSA